jgi:Flp pilus assembly protein TadD
MTSTRRQLGLLLIGLLALTALGQEPPAKLPSLSAEEKERLALLHAEGRALWTEGRFTDALKPARAVVEIRRRAQGEGHWELVDAEWLVKTLEAAAQAPAAAQAELARFHELKQTIATLTSKRSHAEAENAARRQLAAFRTGLGEDWPLTAHGYNELGFLLLQQGKLTEAEPLLRRGIAIYGKVFSDEHPTTTVALANLADCLEDQGRLAEALPIQRQICDSRLKALGGDHPLTLSALNNLAVALQRHDRVAEAVPLLRQVLEVRERSLGADHPQTAAVRTNLGATQEALGKYAEAEQSYRRALPVLVQHLGEHHPHATVTLNNLASVVGKQGRHAEAVELVKQTLELHRKHDGEGHALTARAWSNLGFHLDNQGQHQQGEAAARKALALRQQLWGDDHPDTALSHYNLSLNLAAQRRDAEAVAAGTAAAASYEMARLRLGARGLDRAYYGNERSPYRLLAALHARAGRVGEAQQAFEHDLARGLLDDVRSRRGSDLDASQQTRRLQLLKQIQELRSQIAQKSGAAEAAGNAEELRQLGRAKAAAEQEFSRFAADVSLRAVAAFADVQRSLPSDAALIAWVDMQDVSRDVDEHWGCVLRAQGPPHWVRLPGAGPNGQWSAPDSQLARRVLRVLAEPEAAPVAERAALIAALVRQRIDPLRAHLQDVRRILVVPWGGDDPCADRGPAAGAHGQLRSFRHAPARSAPAASARALRSAARCREPSVRGLAVEAVAGVGARGPGHCRAV